MQYASIVKDADFAALLSAKGLQWYWNDQKCQAWEPCLNDFLSPTIVEAGCMRWVLADDKFRKWVERFLPMRQVASPRRFSIRRACPIEPMARSRISTA